MKRLFLIVGLVSILYLPAADKISYNNWIDLKWTPGDIANVEGGLDSVKRYFAWHADTLYFDAEGHGVPVFLTDPNGPLPKAQQRWRAYNMHIFGKFLLENNITTIHHRHPNFEPFIIDVAALTSKAKTYMQ